MWDVTHKLCLKFHAHFQSAFASLTEFHLTEGRARSEIVSSSQVHLFMLR